MEKSFIDELLLEEEEAKEEQRTESLLRFIALADKTTCSGEIEVNFKTAEQ